MDHSIDAEQTLETGGIKRIEAGGGSQASLAEMKRPESHTPDVDEGIQDKIQGGTHIDPILDIEAEIKYAQEHEAPGAYEGQAPAQWVALHNQGGRRD